MIEPNVRGNPLSLLSLVATSPNPAAPAAAQHEPKKKQAVVWELIADQIAAFMTNAGILSGAGRPKGSFDGTISIKNGIMTGNGEVTVPAGKYKGSFLNGLPSGKGEMTYFANIFGKYIGPFDGGKPHGQGIEIWTNGNVYQGAYVEGRWQGKGVLTDPQKNMWTVESDQGVVISRTAMAQTPVEPKRKKRKEDA